MKRAILIAPIFVTVIALSGCDRTNYEPSIFRKLGDNSGTLVTDAKQRVIFHREQAEEETTITNTNSTTTKTETTAAEPAKPEPAAPGSAKPEATNTKTTTTETKTISETTKSKSKLVCAEPSPDVSQAMSDAVKLVASLSIEQKSADGATKSAGGEFGYGRSIVSSVAQLGERLAVIQLFRDRMYRACEAYANGAIGKVAYTLMLARNDKTMASLLSSEMAAGAFGRSLASLGGNAGTGGGDPAKRAEVQKTIQDLTTQLTGIAKDTADAPAVRASKADDVSKKLVAAHIELLSLDIAAAQTSASSGMLASAPGGISNRPGASGLEALGTTIAGIHKTYVDDPGLEPLTDACLTALSEVTITPSESPTYRAATELRTESLQRIQMLDQNTIDYLTRLLNEADAVDGVIDLTDQDAITLKDLGVTISRDGDDATTTEADVSNAISSSQASLDNAREDLENANDTISDILLQMGGPFAAFCSKEIFGDLPENGYVRTMLNARQKIRETEKPIIADQIALKKLEICGGLMGGYKELDDPMKKVATEHCGPLLAAK